MGARLLAFKCVQCNCQLLPGRLTVGRLVLSQFMSVRIRPGHPPFAMEALAARRRTASSTMQALKTFHLFGATPRLQVRAVQLPYFAGCASSSSRAALL